MLLHIGKRSSFRIKPSVPAIVGPGTYSIAGTVGTKSFNVTMSQKISSRKFQPKNCIA
ncbi:hypothetical protein Plhal703r1_c80g0173621 [Plasmopara halstedii]